VTSTRCAPTCDLAAMGMEIGSHTARHLLLPKLSPSMIESELLRSKEAITERVGCISSALALPYSYPIVHKRWPSFEAILLAAMEKFGYACCCTLLRGRPTIKGYTVFLPRISVMRTDTPLIFYAKALGIYGHGGLLQSFYQRYFKEYQLKSLPPS